MKLFQYITFILSLTFIFIITLFSLKREGAFLNLVNIILLTGLAAYSTDEYVPLYDYSFITILVLLMFINVITLFKKVSGK